MRHLSRLQNLLPRLWDLKKLHTSPPKTAAIKEYEDILRIIVMSRLKTNYSVCCLHMSNVQYSETVKTAELCLRLASIFIKIKDKESKIKLKNITKLADISGRIWWLPLDVDSLLQLKNAMREYHICKKNYSKIRDTYQEE